MEYLFFVIAGAIGGVFGGMGMGGGTLLIPILTIFFGVGQHTAQAVNLICFIPMSILALIIHIKNGKIDFKNILLIILPGLLTCFIGCYVSKHITGDMLGKIFGGFLILLSIFQVVSLIKSTKKKN